jgi:hypothetical protein
MDYLNRKTGACGDWWLTPVIQATQEAEIKRMVVQSQPQQIVLETPFSKKIHHKKELLKV